MEFMSFSSSGRSTALVTALNKSFAVIEFQPNGIIITANDLFCSTMGYELDEIRGRHHSMFVEPQTVNEHAYKEFWDHLADGKFSSGEYKRISKSGAPIWLQASYTPVLDSGGKVVKVVKFALDITQARMKAAEDLSMIQAIFRSQAVIEFTREGIILDANDAFLKVVGYSRDEVVGQHHRMFAEAAYTDSVEYREFWRKLANGEFLADEFRRLGKGGREVWLQASYNPVFDADGKITKVVKFATDLTERMGNVARVGKSLSDLAGGDLEGRLEGVLMPSLDKLRVDFNAAAETLQQALSVVSACTQAIHTGSGEISASAEELSRRTEQQAARLEETAAALQEITATVKKTADGALQARDAVRAAKADAEQSGQVVQDAVSAMGEIAKGAREISQIIG